MRFSPIDRLHGLHTAVVLRKVRREANGYAHARQLEKSGAAAVDPWVRRIARASQTRPITYTLERYTTARSIDPLSPALADALERWHLQLLVTKARFRLTQEVWRALASGASHAAIEDRLSSLDPDDVPEIITLDSKSIELATLRFKAAQYGECQLLLRSGAVVTESERLRYRRQAALALLDVIQALTEARSARIEAADIVAAISSLEEQQDADRVLAIRDHDWPTARLARLRTELLDDPLWRRERSCSDGACGIDELSWGIAPAA